MLTYFRRIRRSLLSNKGFGKYIIYATGEIILVVIGILIALSINNWNEGRKDRFQEQKILRQLADEFRLNLNQIDNKIKLRNYIIKQSTEVIALMDSKQSIDLDALLQKMSVVLLAPTFDRLDNEEMNYEKIQLITNDSLKKYLNNWSSSITNLKEQENEWVNLLNNYTIPLFIDLGISRNINISFYEDPNNLDYFLDHSNKKAISLPKSMDMPSVQDLLNNKKIEGILANAVLLNEGINWESEGYRQRILKILNLIEDQIE